MFSSRYTTGKLSIFLFINIACILCWIAGYIFSIGYPVYGEISAPPLWNYICQIMPEKGITFMIGFFLMVGGAFLVHMANYSLMLIREKTLLPVLFYMLLSSTNLDFFPIKSASFGVFCLVLAIYQLFISYHNPYNTYRAFNASFIIGVESLLWTYILCFLPLFWFGMYKFRSLNIRSFVASVMGVITIYWFVFGWCVWQSDYSALSIPYHTLFKIQPLQIFNSEWTDWIGIIYGVILISIASINIITHKHEDNLRIRQFLSFLILMTVWSFGLFFLYEQSSEEFLQVIGLPASILIAHFFTVVKGKYVFWMFNVSLIAYFIFFILRIWNFL